MLLLLQLTSFSAFLSALIALETTNDVVDGTYDIERWKRDTRSVIFFTNVAMILEVLLIVLRFLNIGYFNNKIKIFLIIVSYQ